MVHPMGLQRWEARTGVGGGFVFFFGLALFFVFFFFFLVVVVYFIFGLGVFISNVMSASVCKMK